MKVRITSLPEPELVAKGAVLRTPYLLQQANYTSALAHAEGKPLADRMAPGLVDKVDTILGDATKAYEDKTVSGADAKLSTGTQNSAAHNLRVWGRGATARASSAIRAGALIPDEMTNPLDARPVPALIAQAQRQLSLLQQHAQAMDKVGAPTQPLIDEGRALCEALIAADRSQEFTRASTLPKAVADFYALKAELYNGLKMINDAGHELYASNPAASSRFNLSLLYRRHVAGTTEPAPAPAPPTAPPAAAT